MRNQQDNLWLMGIMLAAILLRLWGTFDYQGYFYDEGVHVPSALSLLQYGTPMYGHWLHPPFGDLLLCGSISLFGDNPYGWRLIGVVFGTATVALTYLVAKRLYPPDSRVPLIAAAILAFDPFHAHFSRTIFMEIPALCFFLLFVYFLLTYIETSTTAMLFGAGIGLGLTIATKGAYFPLCIVLLLGYAIYADLQKGRAFPQIALDFGVILILLPVAIYLFSYIYWFGRGFTFSEFIVMQQDALSELRNAEEKYFPGIKMLRLGGKPWEWFLKPISNGFQLGGESGFNRFQLEINNPPFRLLVLPAAGFLLWQGWRLRQFKELAAPLLFCAGYIFLLLIDRPIFSYSALVLLPCAYLCVARCITYLADSVRKPGVVYGTAIATIVVWGLYTLPLYAVKSVPLSLYQPILSFTKFVDVR